MKRFHAAIRRDDTSSSVSNVWFEGEDIADALDVLAAQLAGWPESAFVDVASIEISEIERTE